MRRYEVSDAQWQAIASLLPPERNGMRGRPWADNRIVLNGIVWILRAGAPWKDLPERYGSKSTAQRRLSRWQQDGTWQKILAELQKGGEPHSNVVWFDCSLDSSSVKAHQHAAGARKQKGGPAAGRTEIYVHLVDRPSRRRSVRKKPGRT